MGENMDKIEKFLDKEIRPYLKSHGGDIEIINYSIEKQELNLRLKGQCCVCPHSIETNENFIKKSILEKFSEIKNIYIETGVSDELWNLAKSILKEDRNGKLERKV